MQLKIFPDEFRLEASYQDHVQAGYVYSESESIDEINRTNAACMVLKRGDSRVCLSLDDSSAAVQVEIDF